MYYRDILGTVLLTYRIIPYHTVSYIVPYCTHGLVPSCISIYSISLRFALPHLCPGTRYRYQDSLIHPFPSLSLACRFTVIVSLAFSPLSSTSGVVNSAIFEYETLWALPFIPSSPCMSNHPFSLKRAVHSPPTCSPSYIALHAFRSAELWPIALLDQERLGGRSGKQLCSVSWSIFHCRIGSFASVDNGGASCNWRDSLDQQYHTGDSVDEQFSS